MVSRTTIGAVTIFIGILLFLSGFWDIILRSVIGTVPIVGDLFNLFSPSVSDEQMLYILLGLVLMFIGVLIARRRKN